MNSPVPSAAPSATGLSVPPITRSVARQRQRRRRHQLRSLQLPLLTHQLRRQHELSSTINAVPSNEQVVERGLGVRIPPSRATSVASSVWSEVDEGVNGDETE